MSAASTTRPACYSRAVRSFPVLGILLLCFCGGGGNSEGDQRGTTYTAFGDSFTYCYGVVVPADCYVNRIAAAKNWTFTNDGYNGTAANDPEQFGVIVQIVNGTTANYSWLCCVNDMRNNLNAAQIATWQTVVEAGLWWLATPESNKIRSKSSSITYAESWSLPPSNYSGNMQAATSNGATAFFAVFGTDVVVIPGWQLGNTSTYSITVDGTTYGPFNTNQGAYTSIAFSTNYGPGCFHLLGLEEQIHNVTFTCASTSGSGNPCYFIAGGTSFRANLEEAPYVYLGETARLEVSPDNGYNVTTSPGCPVAPCGSLALTTSFDQYARWAVADLAAVKLKVAFVDVNSYYTPNTTNTQSDGVHPTDIGDRFIAQAFLASINGFISATDRAATQSFNQP